MDNFEIIAEESDINKRIDVFLSKNLESFSRSYIQDLIKKGKATIGGKTIKANYRLREGDIVALAIPKPEPLEILPENIPLDIVYEDNDVILVNKPKGMVVHPAAGHYSGTLVNALLAHCTSLSNLSGEDRPGIVHRLDKDTTGLMVVAKTIPAQTQLVRDLQKRKITREYEAVACGIMTKGGTVDEPMARHPTKRTHMAVHPMGKPAVTHYRIMERFRDYTRLRLRLETGRTHQIRVHMAHIAHPLLGDQTYGGRPRPPKNASEELMEVLRNFKRQALHAVMLRLQHPISGEMMEWYAPLPDDFVELVTALKADYVLHKDELDY